MQRRFVAATRLLAQSARPCLAVYPVRTFHTHKPDDDNALYEDPRGFKEAVNEFASENYNEFATPESHAARADRITDEEHELLLGISEFKTSIEQFHAREFDKAETSLKEALTILKNADQSQSLGYIYLLKRLAYVCFMSRKYSESEKYFKVAAELMPKVSKNPVNIYNSRRNLLLLYTHSDLEKAKTLGAQMMTDLDEFLPLHSKELNFMMANIHFLSGNHQQAKDQYRQVLKLAPKPKLEAQILNNLAFTSWMHVLELPKMEDAREKESVLNEEKFVMVYLKQCIKTNEKATNPDVDLKLLDELFNLELEGKEQLTDESTEEFFSLLQGEGSGKAICNLSEYLLMTQALKGEIRTAAFWFRCGVKYFERVQPDQIDRQLIMLGLFYASREKRMMAEGLYREVLDKLDHDTSNQAVSYNLVMALNFYGRMLLFNPKRKREAQEYLTQAEEIAKMMPYWYDKLDSIYMPEFELD